MVRSTFKGVEVWIEAKGQRIREYEDNEITEEERTTTRYIEAKTGQEFAIRVRLWPATKFAGDCMVFRVHVDGTSMGGFVLNKTSRYGILEGQVKPNYIRKFTFAKLETVHDGKVSDTQIDKAKALGKIEVVVTHEQGGSRVPNRDTNEDIETNNVVDEKAIKGQALSHSVGFGNIKHVQAPYTRISYRVPGVPNPAAVVRFRYRSLEALKSMLIIRDPQPLKPLEERDSASLTPAEVSQLQNKYKASKLNEAQATPVKIKREREDESPQPRKVARRQGPGARAYLEIDDDGNVRESSTSEPPTAEPEVIVLD